MSSAWTYVKRMSNELEEGQIKAGKLQTPVDLGVTTGTILVTPSYLCSTQTLTVSNNGLSPMDDSINSRLTLDNPDISEDIPLKLGYLDIQGNPEVQEPPEIVGIIHGQPARMFLDSDCSTYVLSTDFATKAKINSYPTNSVPVQLAI